MAIRGDTVGTPIKRADWDEADPKKGSFITGKKPTIHKEADGNHTDHDIIMDNHRIKGLPAPTGGDQPMTKQSYTDSYNSEWTQTKVSLPSGRWAGNEQSVSVPGVTASNKVDVAPAPENDANVLAISDNVVRAVRQASGTLTFRCVSVPPSTVEFIVGIRRAI